MLLYKPLTYNVLRSREVLWCNSRSNICQTLSVGLYPLVKFVSEANLGSLDEMTKKKNYAYFS